MMTTLTRKQRKKKPLEPTEREALLSFTRVLADYGCISDHGTCGVCGPCKAAAYLRGMGER